MINDFLTCIVKGLFRYDPFKRIFVLTQTLADVTHYQSYLSRSSLNKATVTARKRSNFLNR